MLFLIDGQKFSSSLQQLTKVVINSAQSVTNIAKHYLLNSKPFFLLFIIDYYPHYNCLTFIYEVQTRSTT